MNTILISSAESKAGKTTVLQALQVYCQRYRSDQACRVMQIPGMSSWESELDLAQLWRSLSQQQQDHDGVWVESDGSLGTPVTADTTMAALARDWRLPTILVVPVAWEAIASTVAAIALAHQTRVELMGVILNHPLPEPTELAESVSPPLDAEAMADLLRSLTQVSVLGTIPFLPDIHDEDALARAASDLMVDVLLEKIFRLDPTYA